MACNWTYGYGSCMLHDCGENSGDGCASRVMGCHKELGKDLCAIPGVSVNSQGGSGDAIEGMKGKEGENEGEKETHSPKHPHHPSFPVSPIASLFTFNKLNKPSFSLSSALCTSFASPSSEYPCPTYGTRASPSPLPKCAHVSSFGPGGVRRDGGGKAKGESRGRAVMIQEEGGVGEATHNPPFEANVEHHAKSGQSRRNSYPHGRAC